MDRCQDEPTPTNDGEHDGDDFEEMPVKIKAKLIPLNTRERRYTVLSVWGSMLYPAFPNLRPARN